MIVEILRHKKNDDKFYYQTFDYHLSDEQVYIRPAQLSGAVGMI